MYEESKLKNYRARFLRVYTSSYLRMTTVLVMITSLILILAGVKSDKGNVRYTLEPLLKIFFRIKELPEDLFGPNPLGLSKYLKSLLELLSSILFFGVSFSRVVYIAFTSYRDDVFWGWSPELSSTDMILNYWPIDLRNFIKLRSIPFYYYLGRVQDLFSVFVNTTFKYNDWYSLEDLKNKYALGLNDRLSLANTPTGNQGEALFATWNHFAGSITVLTMIKVLTLTVAYYTGLKPRTYLEYPLIMILATWTHYQARLEGYRAIIYPALEVLVISSGPGVAAYLKGDFLEKVLSSFIWLTLSLPLRLIGQRSLYSFLCLPWLIVGLSLLYRLGRDLNLSRGEPISLKKPYRVGVYLLYLYFRTKGLAWAISHKSLITYYAHQLSLREQLWLEPYSYPR